MAEETGVRSSENRPESGGGGGKRGGFLKKNKGLVIGGGALAAFLLLSHKGSSANQQSSTNAQAQQDALAAQEAALESGAVIPPQGYGPNVTGQSGDGSADGGSGGATGTGGSATDPSVDPNGALADAINNLATAEAGANANGNTPGASTEPAATGKPGRPGKGSKTGKGKSHNKKKTTAHANPNTHHSGGSGAVVHGRTFPGAHSARVGPSRRVNGNTVNEVTINYGGHSDIHTSINQGANWQDHTGGPPSRRVVHSAPPVHKPPPHPEPVHRPAHPVQVGGRGGRR